MHIGYKSEPGIRTLYISQCEYAKTLVQRCRETSKFDKKLRNADTPFIEVPVHSQMHEGPGVNAETCRSHVGGCLFLARCTRPDISFEVGLLGRKVDRWTAADDVALHRLMEYISGTAEAKLSMVFHDDHFKHFSQRSWADSDLAGDPDSRKSTSGWFGGWWRGGGSLIPIFWSSKLQKMTAPSTGHAEVSAINMCLRADHLMAADLLRSLYGRDRRSDMLSDSSAAISCVGSGGASSTLRYLNKYEGISIGFIRDAFLLDDQMALIKEDSANNVADLFTKALPATTFGRLRRLCGVIL